MQKFFVRGAVVAASMFFVICLADSPNNRVLSASKKEDAGIISVEAAMDVEHRALDILKNEEIENNNKTTEEIFAALNNLDADSNNSTTDGLNYVGDNLYDELNLFSSDDNYNSGTVDDIKSIDDINNVNNTNDADNINNTENIDNTGNIDDADISDNNNNNESTGSNEGTDINNIDTEDDFDKNDGQASANIDGIYNDGSLDNIESNSNDDLNEASEFTVLSEGYEGFVIAGLQERLMELGFMDYAEPTEYFGSITKMAVMLFQRQNELEQDGIVTYEIFNMIMSPDAKFYLIKKGITGDDVLRIQTRLYETGYLSSSEYLTGYFGDITEQAVKKMQEVNGLTADGIIGQMTIELLYSEDIKSNYITAGEKSDEVLKYQQRLKELGYLTTKPDGIFGTDTVVAVKQFQSRNDLIVDGYLGPTTCQVLMSAGALPNGLSLGDRGDNVKSVQLLLSKYGYMVESNATGYFGEITQAAVKAFQKANGLTADGMVGMQTMSSLTGNSVTKASSNTSSSSSSTSSSSGSSSSNSSSNNSNSSSSQTNGSVNELINVALSKLGCKYSYGSRGPNSFDCSGFVYWCLNQVGVKQSYISSYGWRSVTKYVKITKFSDIKPGDIIVVKGHVGIAGYDGTVIDASSSNGKIVHRGLGDYWKKNFIVAWRIF